MDGGGYGQNIGYGTPPDDIGAMITNMMYNGEMGYYTLYGKEPDMKLFEKWGHFSQIVWKATTKVGCATKLCQRLGKGPANQPSNYTVCNYRGAGNMGGAYAKNVLKPRGDPTVRA